LPPPSFSSLSPLHVIKKCSALEGPAIFFNFKDCQFYLDLQDEEDDDEEQPLGKAWEYDLFDTLEEAIAFLKNDQKQPPLPSSSSASSSASRQQIQDDANQKNDNESDENNNQNQKRKRFEEEDEDFETRRLKRALELQRLEKERTRIKLFEKNLALLHQFKQDYGDCDVPMRNLRYESSDNTATTGNGGAGGGSTSAGGGANVVATTAADVAEDDDDGGGAATTTTTTTSAVTSTGLTDPALATAFSPAPPCIKIDWEKYGALGKWVSRMRTYIVMYQNVVTRESSILTGEQVQRLLDLGFVMEPRRNKAPNKAPRLSIEQRVKQSLKVNRIVVQRRRAKRFQKNLALLLQFKQDYGDCDVPMRRRECGSLDNTTTTGNVGGSTSVCSRCY
jgi:hypothetical protein